MNKAILVIDKPKRCEDCILFYDDKYTCYATGINAVGMEAELCPLKELPSKIPQFFQNKKCFSDKEKGCFQGWNDCLSEILGDIDEQV